MSEPHLSNINDTLEKVMEKLTELRLTFQMKSQPKNNHQNGATFDNKSALGTPLDDLTSSMSNLLTSAVVEMRSQIRLVKVEGNKLTTQTQKTLDSNHTSSHHNQQHHHSSSSSPCKQCKEDNNNFNSFSSSSCVHKSALADRVIDRAFDQHKAMLREELKEVKAELDKFRSGSLYQSLRQRIDELELKMREIAKTNNNSKSSKEAQHFSIDRNEKDQIVNVRSFDEEKKLRMKKLQDEKKETSSQNENEFSLSTVDDMIANFKNRCDERAQKRIDSEEKQKVVQQKEEQMKRANERQEEKRLSTTSTLNNLLLGSLIRNFNNFLSSVQTEETGVYMRKTDLLFTSMMKVVERSEVQIPPIPTAPKPREEAISSRGENRKLIEDLISKTAVSTPPTIVTSGRRRTSSTTTKDGKTLDVSKKPIHSRRY